MSKLLGMCGDDCSACGAYQATQANDAERIAEIAAGWSREFNTNVPPERVWCDGCTGAGARKCGHCAECGIRACGMAKQYATCAECDTWCENLLTYLAHEPALRVNLEALRETG